jgi:hypothetical protein
MTNGNALLAHQSSRGGYRENAGRKSSWQHGKTQTIRVPKVFASQLIQIARRLDNGEEIASDTKSKRPDIDTVTNSKPDCYDNVTESILAMTEALIQAQAILKGKRSARASLAKLLSAIYHTQIGPDDLN